MGKQSQRRKLNRAARLLNNPPANKLAVIRQMLPRAYESDLNGETFEPGSRVRVGNISTGIVTLEPGEEYLFVLGEDRVWYQTIEGKAYAPQENTTRTQKAKPANG